MAGQREEVSLRVLKNVSGVSAPFELLQNAAQRRFVSVECYKVNFTVMRCMTFSNVFYIFGSFMNNKFGHVYISAWVGRFASVTEIRKYVTKLLLFACLVFSWILMWNGIQVSSELNWLSFFPQAGVLCLVKCEEDRFWISVFLSWWRL